MEEIFNEVKVNEYKIGSLWRSFYSSIVALLLSYTFQAVGMETTFPLLSLARNICQHIL